MIKVQDLIDKYGCDYMLVLRDKDGNAAPIRYVAEDQGLLSPDEDVVHLLSQNSIHDLEQLHQTGELDFFSVLVVDV